MRTPFRGFWRGLRRNGHAILGFALAAIFTASVVAAVGPVKFSAIEAGTGTISTLNSTSITSTNVTASSSLSVGANTDDAALVGTGTAVGFSLLPNCAGPSDVLRYDTATNSFSCGAVSASPGGANTQIQFNDSGVLGGDSYLTWNKTTKRLSILSTAHATNTIDISNRPCCSGEIAAITNPGDGTAGGLEIYPRGSTNSSNAERTTFKLWTVDPANESNARNFTISIINPVSGNTIMGTQGLGTADAPAIHFVSGITSFSENGSTSNISLSNDKSVTFSQDTVKITPTAGSNETSLWVKLGGVGSYYRVSVGAADSCGTGYRCLRIPN
jgi:hypothetical protein